MLAIKQIFIFALAIFVSLSSGIFAQAEEKPVLAVLDLRPEKVDESDARIITEYVEEAIFKTDKFVLVERNQIRFNIVF